MGIYLYQDNCLSICFWKNGKKNGLEKCIINKTKISYKNWKDNILTEKCEQKNFMNLLKSMNYNNNIINIFNMNYDELIIFLDIL